MISNFPLVEYIAKYIAEGDLTLAPKVARFQPNASNWRSAVWVSQGVPARFGCAIPVANAIALRRGSCPDFQRG